jgi:hypothetical protein
MGRSSEDEGFEDVKSEASDKSAAVKQMKSMTTKELIDHFFPGLLDISNIPAEFKPPFDSNSSSCSNEQILEILKPRWDVSETKKKFEETLSHLAIR